MVVLDASVILKWLVSEKDSDAALRLRDYHVQGKESIIVPSILFYEVANVLRYNKNIPNEELIALLEILHNLELVATHPSFPELEEAAIYAREKNISIYDTSYVVLAKKIGCDLITADRRLVKAASEPFIKLLQ